MLQLVVENMARVPSRATTKASAAWRAKHLLAAVAMLAIGAEAFGYSLRSSDYLEELDTYDAFVDQSKELVVVPTGSTLWAQTGIWVLDLPYSSVADVEREMAKLLTIDSSQQIQHTVMPEISNPIPSASKYADDLPITVNETRLKSKRKGPASLSTAYSALEIRLLDGALIFGGPCIVVSVKRTDHTREWGRIAHVPFVVLPIRVETQTTLLTDSEMRFMKSLIEALGVEHRGPVLRTNGLDPFGRWQSILEIRESLGAVP